MASPKPSPGTWHDGDGNRRSNAEVTLQSGAAVQVFSRTANEWFVAEVVKPLDGNCVRAEWSAGDHIYGKRLHMCSDHLIIPATSPNSVDEAGDPDVHLRSSGSEIEEVDPAGFGHDGIPTEEKKKNARINRALQKARSDQELLAEIKKCVWSFNSFNAYDALRRVAERHVAKKDIECLEAVLERLSQGISELDARGIATTLWALATLDIERPDFVRMLCEAAEKKQIQDFKAQDIAHSLWALAKMKIQPLDLEDLVGHLSKAAKENIQEFNSQNIANSLWALATLRIEHKDLVSDLCKAARAKEKLSGFTSQGIANSLWALATLKIEQKYLVSDLCKAARAKEKIQEFTSHGIANSLWALATLKIDQKDLVGHLCKAAKDKIQDFNAQAIANSMWALSLIGSQHGEDTEACAKVGAPVLDPDFIEYMDTSKIAWIKVGYLRDLQRQEKKFVRRQELPEGKYVKSEASLLAKTGLRFVVSHPWLAREHPDPEGLQLRALVEELRQKKARDDDLVFISYSSMYQHDHRDKGLQELKDAIRRGEKKKEDLPKPGTHPSVRTPEQQTEFNAGLKDMWRLYCNRRFNVLALPDVPGTAANPNPYINRGWCYLESSLSYLNRTLSNKENPKVRDLLAHMPADPDDFENQLKDKVFTSGDKRDVEDQFKRVFQDKKNLDNLLDRVLSGA